MKILKDNSILQSSNYCGLKHESTDTFIHILNNIMEDAWDNKQELWLLF